MKIFLSFLVLLSMTKYTNASVINLSQLNVALSSGDTEIVLMAR